MLASLGFLVGEQWHPLFGGSIDVPSYIAFQSTPLQTSWKTVILVIGVLELASMSAFKFPLASGWSDGSRYFKTQLFELKTEHDLGNFGFDPVGLKPKSDDDLKTMQTKELNNGRLAMLAIAGMVGQELATNAKLF